MNWGSRDGRRVYGGLLELVRISFAGFFGLFKNGCALGLFQEVRRRRMTLSVHKNRGTVATFPRVKISTS